MRKVNKGCMYVCRTIPCFISISPNIRFQSPPNQLQSADLVGLPIFHDVARWQASIYIKRNKSDNLPKNLTKCLIYRPFTVFSHIKKLFGSSQLWTQVLSKTDKTCTRCCTADLQQSFRNDTYEKAQSCWSADCDEHAPAGAHRYHYTQIIDHLL